MNIHIYRRKAGWDFDFARHRLLPLIAAQKELAFVFIIISCNNYPVKRTELDLRTKFVYIYEFLLFYVHVIAYVERSDSIRSPLGQDVFVADPVP